MNKLEIFKRINFLRQFAGITCAYISVDGYKVPLSEIEKMVYLEGVKKGQKLENIDEILAAFIRSGLVKYEDIEVVDLDHDLYFINWKVKGYSLSISFVSSKIIKKDEI